LELPQPALDQQHVKWPLLVTPPSKPCARWITLGDKDGIILVNHGGRQVERGAPPITLLSEVAQALGEKTPIFVDSAIMSGAELIPTRIVDFYE